MNKPSTESLDGVRRPQFRLDSGWDVFEEWSQSAGQIEKNAVHKALFAIADRTAFTDYEILDVTAPTRDVFVLVRKDLVLKVHLRDLDTFAIAYVGPAAAAPGLELAE
ncbi:DUF6235 family protein [Streptomyces boluensis]|uniref:Uncharacterized protein n=1 Tax=Streptomyces boluensis TaxID=1775135 RepID=A0A964US53_9ACTN|nr:DUF6235 family protein [Streptomyces boluensis]NBE53772.1 hypothetical protein [Streptomyces boluensis]